MKSQPLSVLYEDNHLLIVDKPAGLATMGVAAGETSLVTLAKDYLKTRYRKPGNVYLGVVSRLDASVSGVIALARTSKSAARLSEQFREGLVSKRYWAIVSPLAEPREGSLEDWLIKDEAAHRVRVAGGSASNPAERAAVRARLSYRTLGVDARQGVLEIELETGRKHQIRVQLSHRDWPIVGDRKYGSSVPFGRGIALHAIGLRIMHPTKNTPLVFRCPPPPSWNLRRFGIDFAGQSLNLE